MRKTKFFSVLSTCITLFAWAQLAAAQQGTVGNEPQKVESLDELEPPAVNIRTLGSNASIVEKRERGHVTSIRVQSGTSTYYVQPDTPLSNVPRYGPFGSANRAAQWQVMQFDWNEEPERAKATAARAAVSAPLPPSSVPAKN